MKKYFILIVTFCLMNHYWPYNMAQAEVVCVTKDQAVDIVTLLDASEKDLNRLDTCSKLVDELYKELEIRDKNLENLTKKLIESKKDAIEFKASAKRWRAITWYTGGAAAGAVVIIVLITL